MSEFLADEVKLVGALVDRTDWSAPLQPDMRRAYD
jgi:hypothetical protein